MPPGTYTLTFELAGFNGFRREGIQILLGFTATVDAQMRPRRYRNAVETRAVTTGTAFNRPTTLLAPRTARVGVRTTF